jgi:hypothetical protein
MAAEIRRKAEPIMKQAGVLCLHPLLQPDQNRRFGHTDLLIFADLNLKKTSCGAGADASLRRTHAPG